jgi:hypothetical protein
MNLYFRSSSNALKKQKTTKNQTKDGYTIKCVHATQRE